MSEISVLSHEYLAAADLSQRINVALICLKKSVLWPDEQEASPAEVNACREELATILMGLIPALRARVVDRAASGETSRIPGALVVQLLESKQGNPDDYIEELARTARRLQEPHVLLSEDDFQLLDELAAMASVQTSQVFNRMMRK